MLDNIKVADRYVHVTGSLCEGFDLVYIARTGSRWHKALLLARIIIPRGAWNHGENRYDQAASEYIDNLVRWARPYGYQVGKDNKYVYRVNSSVDVQDIRTYNFPNSISDFFKRNVGKDGLSAIVNHPNRAKLLDYAKNRLMEECVTLEIDGRDSSCLEPIHKRFGFTTQKAYKQFINYLNNDVDISPWFDTPAQAAA